MGNPPPYCGGYELATLEHVAHAAEGLDELFVVAFLDFIAHAADEDVDDVGLRVEGVVPDVRKDLGFGKSSAI
jgi:hypothetical protein